MMGKLPLGVVSPYVKMSSGGCTDPMKFYATTYCTAYGWEGFKPRTGSHKGTGLKSNYQPGVSCQASVNASDNPATGEQGRNEFQAVTSQSCHPREVPDGKYPPSCNLYQNNSGYSLEKANLAPPIKEVRKVLFDTQDGEPQAITGLDPRLVAPLPQQQSKGSLEWENARRGPRFTTSECNSKYLKELSHQPDLLQKSVCAKEETGFIEESTRNPTVFQPSSQAFPGDPVLLPGRSVTKSGFLPRTQTHEGELLPQLARGSEREMGFSGVSERPLNCRVPPSSPEPRSMTHWQFRHPQRVQQTNVAMLGRETMGHKEPTGYSLNNASYFRSPYDMDNRYLTTYNQEYCESILRGLNREGWTRGAIQLQRPGGYTLNQPVTHMEGTHNPTESLRHLYPPGGRTRISADPSYRSPLGLRHGFANPMGQEPPSVPIPTPVSQRLPQLLS